jgi:glutamate-1-semialdehyde 2,1-aminomutase
MTGPKSRSLFDEAQRLLPGGVSSPVRAFRAVGGAPFFTERAAGARLFDADGNSYIDYVGSWGPMILGHAHPAVVAAIAETAARGSSFGTPSYLEVELARRVIARFPSIEMVRFVSSGTEATMSAVRLARGATGRDLIVKFDGCYHGHVDALLVRAGSGPATFGIPGTPGVPESVTRQTLTLPFNDLAAARDAFTRHEGKIAAVIVEPIPGNMGVVPPGAGFLEGLREITSSAGALLIFDEVISGFRASPGGAQALFGIRPDLTCLGKILGGGLPVGAYGGRRDLMERISPLGPVYQAGTLSGNPLAMAAGIATLDQLAKPGFYESLDRAAEALAAGLEAGARAEGVAVRVNRAGSLLTLFFAADPVTDFASASRSDTQRFARYHGAMLERGVFLPPSQFEAWFVSAAHAESEIEETVRASREALAAAVRS